jgi:hypothetical protein
MPLPGVISCLAFSYLALSGVTTALQTPRKQMAVTPPMDGTAVLSVQPAGYYLTGIIWLVDVPLRRS